MHVSYINLQFGPIAQLASIEGQFGFRAANRVVYPCLELAASLVVSLFLASCFLPPCLNP